jgi:photosystem II stability/assembly factor-like uncharacterized protein
MNADQSVCAVGRAMIVIFFMLPAAAHGEDFWHSTRVSPHGPINAVTIDASGRLVAGSDSGWIHTSTDGGITWRSSEIAKRSIRHLALDPSGWLVAGLDSGVVTSGDGGISWTPAGLEDRAISALAGDGSGTLYAGTSHGVVSSTNAGGSWNILPPVPGTPVSLASRVGAVFAGTDSGLYRSAGGQPWVRILPFKGVLQISRVSETTFLAVSQCDTGSILFRSTDGGVSWASILDAPRTGLLVAVTPGSMKLLLTAYHWGRFGRSWEFLFSADSGNTWRSTATRADHSPSSVSPHPSGRVFMLVSAPGGG